MRDTQQALPALSVLATPLMGATSSNGTPLSPFSIKREEAAAETAASMSENLNQIPNLFSGPFGTAVTSTVDQKEGKSNTSKPPLTENNNSTFRGVSQGNAIKEEPTLEGNHNPVSNNMSRSADIIQEGGETVIEATEKETKEVNVEKPGRGRPKKIVQSTTPPLEVTTSSVISKDTSFSPKESVSEKPTSQVPSNSVSAAAMDTTKRQKIDLKGPRVKHVCRSASIVLGQPLATFPLESLDTPPRPDSPSNVNMVDPQTSRHDCSTCITEEEQQNLGLSPPATPVNAGEGDGMEVADSVVPETANGNVNAGDLVLRVLNREEVPQTTISSGKGTRKASKSLVVHSVPAPTIPNRNQGCGNMARRTTAMNQQQQQHQNYQSHIPMISLDFWENYDPVEISQMGFGLIVTESVPLRSLCFLCGSLGSPDSLMYCVCCCEPYHQYCIEDEYNVKPSLDETMNISVMHSQTQQEMGHLNWLCPRCTVCSTCNMSSGTKLRCQKCQKNYHSTCLGTSKRLLGADRPLICAACLKCKSCGTGNVSKFVGNLPMCTACFKLRQRGNFCPLCQKCYEENDFDLKMMECGECEKWVHARCEVSKEKKFGHRIFNSKLV